MDDTELEKTRRAKLGQWFAGRKRPPKEKSYLSQLLSSNASFGEKAARRLERDYGMPVGYLDGRDDVTDAEWALLKMIRENGISPKQVMVAVSALAGPVPDAPSATDSRLSRRKPVDTAMSFDILSKKSVLDKKTPSDGEG